MEMYESCVSKDLACKIEETIDNFDYATVKVIMEVLDWKWYLRGDLTQPYLTDMISTSRYLLSKAAFESFRSKQPSTVGTGGFYATVDASNGYAKLWFEVTSWESWNED